MSARASSRSPSATGIPDDLESFFHVILWHSIKYLPHNCKDVHSFMSAFFNSVRLYNGECSCGGTKLMAMEKGFIDFYYRGTADSLLTFFYDKTSDRFHPLLGFIEDVLPLFEEYYLATSRLRSRRKPSRGRAIPTHEQNHLLTQEQLSHQLDDHTAFSGKILFWLSKMDWPENDRTDDERWPSYDADSEKYQAEITTKLNAVTGPSRKRRRAGSISQPPSSSSEESSENPSPQGCKAKNRRTLKKRRSSKLRDDDM